MICKQCGRILQGTKCNSCDTIVILRDRSLELDRLMGWGKGNLEASENPEKRVYPDWDKDNEWPEWDSGEDLGEEPKTDWEDKPDGGDSFDNGGKEKKVSPKKLIILAIIGAVLLSVLSAVFGIWIYLHIKDISGFLTIPTYISDSLLEDSLSNAEKELPKNMRQKTTKTISDHNVQIPQ